MYSDVKSENKGKQKLYDYLDLAREFLKMWNMKVSVIPIIALGTNWECWRFEENLKKPQLQYCWDHLE